MCGIFGYVDWRGPLPSIDHLARVTNLLRHRGPDGGGFWTEDGIFLGHRRLAIIDLVTGEQPMASGDGRYVITFNGEIYNYPELRDELCSLGGTFRTASDTEVILEGYRQWGTGVVGRLEGMFAFAIVDRLTRTLLLARDRFGEKPLLFSAPHGRIVFASELAPLVATGVGERAIDLDALGGYLCLNYVPGARTLMRGIERLPPASWQLHDASGGVHRECYWRPGIGEPRAAVDREPLLDELQGRIDDAVRFTLRSDVPVGLFLSGGIDSALVAESAARQGRLKTAFCVDFSDKGFSEWTLASLVARRVGVEIVRVPLSPDVLGRFHNVVAHLDDPLADSSAMAVWTVAEAASKSLKVVLSGDGGDELFGGYLTYPATQMHAAVAPWLPRSVWTAMSRLMARVPVNDAVKVGLDYKLQRLLRAMPLESREAHFTWNGTWVPSDAARFVRGDVAQEAARTALARVAASHHLPVRPSMRQLQIADIGDYLPNDILAKVDRATMAHGLESRAPFLNRRVADMALALPQELRATGSRRTKILVRQLCERHFGREHAQTPKQGFSIPLHHWLRTSARSLVTTLLDPARVGALEVLDVPSVSRAVEAHLSGRKSYGWELWGLMTLVSWHEQRIVEPPDVGSLPPPHDLVEVKTTAIAGPR